MPETVTMMGQRGGGLVSVALTPRRARELGLRALPVRREGGRRVCERTPTMASVEARFGVSTGTAHLHAFRAADDIDSFAARGEKMPCLLRARARHDTADAITKVRQAIDALMSAHGASSFADVSPLQRIWRDSNTAGRHAVADPLVNQEIYGKALLGISYEDNITPLI